MVNRRLGHEKAEAVWFDPTDRTAEGVKAGAYKNRKYLCLICVFICHTEFTPGLVNSDITAVNAKSGYISPT